MNFMNVLLFILCHIIVSHAECNPVKLEVSVSHNKMTLRCIVQNYESKFMIFLACPLGAVCKENCKKTCLDSQSDKKCLSDKMIQCKDKGFIQNTDTYVIEYVIDGTNPINNGLWHCSFKGDNSSPVTVEAQTIPPNKSSASPKPTTNKKTIKTTKTATKSVNKSSTSPKPPTNKNIIKTSSNILTKSEVIVIGLLVMSLIFNIICFSRFCDKSKFKKTMCNWRECFVILQNARHLNRCNSQVSDPERIYENTLTTQRQLSFMTKIRNSNGNYVGQSTLTPSSGPQTLLPPNYLPLNHSMSFPNTQNDGTTPLINTPNQIYYPLPIDSAQIIYGVRSISELNTRDGSNQPLYLAFAPGHQFMPANGRYIQYSQPPLNMTAESTTSSNNRPSPVPSQVKNGPVSRSNSEQDNYKLSREMMEEADNLLRTADTLLKSTQQEMSKIHS